MRSLKCLRLGVIFKNHFVQLVRSISVESLCFSDNYCNTNKETSVSSFDLFFIGS